MFPPKTKRKRTKRIRRKNNNVIQKIYSKSVSVSENVFGKNKTDTTDGGLQTDVILQSPIQFVEKRKSVSPYKNISGEINGDGSSNDRDDVLLLEDDQQFPTLSSSKKKKLIQKQLTFN